MSSELSHGSSWLINHPLLLLLLLLHPALLSSLLPLALPLLSPATSCSPALSWHLPVPFSLSWHSQGSFPCQMQRGFHWARSDCSGRGDLEPAWGGGCSSRCATRDLLHQGHSSCFCSRDTGSAPKQADKCSLFSNILMIFLMTRPGSGEFCWAISGSYNCT